MLPNSCSRQKQFDPEALGFEFTLEQIELRALDLQPDLFEEWALEANRGTAPEA